MRLFDLILFAAALSSLYYLHLKYTRSKPLPPGPRKLPLVGNLFNVPSTFEWEAYMKWSRDYHCDILHLSIAGASLIVLSSTAAAQDLLDKRSAIYSDRARFPMAVELMGWGFNLALMKYGDSWRAHRRSFHNVFHRRAAQLFRPTETRATHELLRRLLRDPDAFMAHFRHMAGEIIMSVAYGIDVLPHNDPYIDLAERAIHTLAFASVPGRFLVDSIPILKHVPSWFPGASFQRKAKAWRKLAHEVMEEPYAAAKHNIAAGNAVHSFAASALRTLEHCENKQEQEQVIKDNAASMYAAGHETTVSALGTFILAMLSNPEAQKKAQAEIDSVVRADNLPDFDDEAAMPYVSALVKEVLRWRPVLPIGVPHFLPVEDEYRGYRLPAGSVVIANTWAILHDEVMYPDPYAFKPERFLLNGKPNPGVQNPDAAFGFGRRVCPGRHLAASSVWIAVASILATFDITKAVGEDGNVIEPVEEYCPNIVMLPLPFKCSIKPRSRKAAAMIQATVNASLV